RIHLGRRARPLLNDGLHDGTSSMTVAFVFPGQGSQSVGMLSGFADSAEARSLLARADEALGEKLSTLLAEGPADALSLTVNTQPAMLVAGYICWNAW